MIRSYRICFYSKRRISTGNTPAAKAEETKAEKFIRLGEYRMNKAIDAIGRIENLANRSAYDYTPEQVEAMFSVLESKVAEVKAKFTATKAKENIQLHAVYFADNNQLCKGIFFHRDRIAFLIRTQFTHTDTERIRNLAERGYVCLTDAARLYRYPFEDQMLIYAQRPDANACATMQLWNEKMYCWVNRGAKGIALFDRKSERPRLKYVFDVSEFVLPQVHVSTAPGQQGIGNACGKCFPKPQPHVQFVKFL